VEELENLYPELEFDIVVVGGGGAGAAAAIEARDRGASVLILEKMDHPGGSTQESGGTVRLVSDRHGTAEHFYALAQGSTPRDVIDAFVDELAEIPEWVKAHGGELVPRSDEELDGTYKRWVFPASRPGTAYPNLPFGESLAPRTHMRPTRPDRVQGAAMWDFLSRNLEELDIPLVVGARATRLVQRFPERSIAGVEVERAPGNLTVKARRGVILCCGGFAYDAELMTQYLGIALPAMSPPGRATGDGVRMAQDVGADLWHMSATSTSVGYNPTELKAGFHCRIPAYGFIMVDQLARRYVCETDLENHAAPHAMIVQDLLSGEYLRVPSFVILDDVTRNADMLTMNERGQNRHYPWSTDNSVEIGRGWIQQANSVAELAKTLGLSADALANTIAEFNKCFDEKTPDQFGRSPERMRPIATPPFYGAAVRPTVLNTQGGPRRNARGQILRPSGVPIPGLFGAGELGSIWSRLYPGAGNVSECLVSGRIAAKSALE
jgi:succinate dehydrogenase/fumarate reductase flavoprotein subunit